jgi:hypothetical protein
VVWLFIDRTAKTRPARANSNATALSEGFIPQQRKPASALIEDIQKIFKKAATFHRVDRHTK